MDCFSPSLSVRCVKHRFDYFIPFFFSFHHSVVTERRVNVEPAKLQLTKNMSKQSRYFFFFFFFFSLFASGEFHGKNVLETASGEFSWDFALCQFPDDFN